MATIKIDRDPKVYFSTFMIVVVALIFWHIEQALEIHHLKRTQNEMIKTLGLITECIVAQTTIDYNQVKIDTIYPGVAADTVFVADTIKVKETIFDLNIP